MQTPDEQTHNRPYIGKVLKLTPPRPVPRRSDAQKRRRRAVFLSFVAVVLLPLLAVSVYYGAIATDRYHTDIGFAVRGTDKPAVSDSIGALTGLTSAGQTQADSYIVVAYLQSRALIEDVNARLNLHKVFSDPTIDPLSRLSPDAEIEDFMRYWNRFTRSHFDPTTGIIEFQVQSFDAQITQAIAATVLELVNELVNELSATARQDALKFAQAEVDLQEQRMREILNEIKNFRAQEQIIDPAATAASDIEVLAGLETRLIDLYARIAAQKETLNDSAPSVVALTRSAQALARQIAARKQNIDAQTGAAAPIPERLARYESLAVERTFAEQAYASALVSLEQARIDADRGQRYLAVYQPPQMAQTAQYPKGVRNTLLLAFALVSLWGTGTLVAYSVRDHVT